MPFVLVASNMPHTRTQQTRPAHAPHTGYTPNDFKQTCGYGRGEKEDMGALT